ncbi:hypothetical protein FRD01_06025 [Microvenator marinus]|uniref:Uncharacterized protein n=1 Tax=Microvenator marinus TaxID=2600177 RepID=A0A5B8XMB9_9DELT|nr:hypothetical protein [Microvenator marinus]QED26804.1 hypothetical protein FRD01_06025 [Microvenator marinus]
MLLKYVILMAALGLFACSDSMDAPPRPIADAGELDFGSPVDMGPDAPDDSGSRNNESDLGTHEDMSHEDMGHEDMDNDMDAGAELDMPADTDMVEDLPDMDQDLQETDTDMDSDAGTPDVGTDSDADMEQDQDTWPPPYDETGWTMSTGSHSDSASTGTPDSYFYEVDPGSPLSATISGSNGIWSVNVYGGMSNQLYCTGSPSCQVMLRPEDTIVVVTAITTNIGSYSLNVRYSGPGLM